LYKQLAAIVGKPYVHQADEVLTTYECDFFMLMKAKPDWVVIPASTEEVANVVRLCIKHQVPFVARGSGTGLSGGVLAVKGGVIISLVRMNRILEINTNTRTATVETGVINGWINREARPFNLFYAPDPSSQSACTLGGNIAENAGGIHCIKYGVTADHILALEVVTPEGDVIWLDQSGEINWLGLFIGSEGTFGIATQAVIQLLPIPQKTKVFLAAFSALTDATNLVQEIMASGLNPAALEFMDDFTVKAVNAAFDVGFPESAQAVLLIELDGTDVEVAITEQRLVKLLNRHQVCELRTAEDEAERHRLWQARKGAVASYGRILPSYYLHDCVIPRGQLTTILQAIQAIGKKYNVLIGNVFHAGDGNLHPHILFDPAEEGTYERVLQAGEEILKACLAVGGVLSGEHGIGMEKSEFMPLQFTPSELAVMQRLKPVFDPKRLANPEKIFPMSKGCGETRIKMPHPLIQKEAMWI